MTCRATSTASAIKLPGCARARVSLGTAYRANYWHCSQRLRAATSTNLKLPGCQHGVHRSCSFHPTGSGTCKRQAPSCEPPSPALLLPFHSLLPWSCYHLSPMFHHLLTYNAYTYIHTHTTLYILPTCTIHTTTNTCRYVSEFLDGCGVTSWQTNSQIVHAVADTPYGPWTREGVSLHAW